MSFTIMPRMLAEADKPRQVSGPVPVCISLLRPTRHNRRNSNDRNQRPWIIYLTKKQWSQNKQVNFCKVARNGQCIETECYVHAMHAFWSRHWCQFLVHIYWFFRFLIQVSSSLANHGLHWHEWIFKKGCANWQFIPNNTLHTVWNSQHIISNKFSW